MKHTVTEVQLQNGAKGLFIHIPGASVMSYEISFRAGEYLVERKKWEAPHLMEHVLLGANEFIPKARLFQAEFEKNGAYSNASTGAYDITYEAECADFEWDRITKLLLIAISKPLFLEDEFIAEFGNVREELNARGNNHFRHLSLALREKYGFASLTDQERVKLMENVTLEDIKQHYQRTHKTSNLRFVIAGKLTQARQKKIIHELESIQLEQGEGRFALPDERPTSLKEPLYIKNTSVKNIYFYLDTFQHKRLNNPETDALSLINTMLTESLYSKILGAAREQGLVYSMSSGLSQTSVSSNWWFGAQVTPENAKRLFEIMVREIAAVRKGTVADKDVQAAKKYALGRYQRTGQSVGGVAAGYSGRYFFDGEIEDYYKVPGRIKHVSKQHVIDVVNDMFKDRVWGFGCLTSASEEDVKKLHKQVSPLFQ